MSCMTLIMGKEHVGDTWKPCHTTKKEIQFKWGEKLVMWKEQKERKERKEREKGNKGNEGDRQVLPPIIGTPTEKIRRTKSQSSCTQ